MNKLLSLLLSVSLLVLPFGALAGNEAVFSVTSSKTRYVVGDKITVSFSVDAGPYAGTLNVIDFDIAISDTSVVEPSDTSSPFTAGSIYSSIAKQSYSSGIINVVSYINPDNKPSSRSGLIGTVTFTALKEGRVTISYNRIEAAEENNETEFVDTSAGSLTIDIVAGEGSVAQSSGGSSVSTSTAKTATATTTTASTGPEHVIAAVIIAVLLATFAVIWYRKEKYYPRI